MNLVNKCILLNQKKKKYLTSLIDFKKLKIQ